jgi:hypothetical protein
LNDDAVFGLTAATKLAVTLMTNGVLATFGAAANYLYAYAHKGKDLHFLQFVVTLFLGFFVGNVVGNFLPHDFAYRDGTLLVAGFSCYPLLRAFETKFPEIFTSRLQGLIGGGQNSNSMSSSPMQDDQPNDTPGQ